MPRSLVVTNDFPPKQGGIENFVYQLVSRLPADEVVVFTSSADGDREFDAELPFPVVRARTRVLLPTAHIRRGAEILIDRFSCNAVYFGAAASLGLMAARLRRTTPAKRFIGSSHSHECFWVKAPPTRAAVRSIAQSLDHLTVISAYSEDAIGQVLRPQERARLVRLSPGVDPAQFAADGAAVRRELGLGRRPVILSVSRLVPHKGQDTLIRALPTVLAAVPEAELAVVGEGPYRERLTRLAEDLRVSDAVHLVGAVPHAEIPPYYAAADVFAFPTRDRTAGLQVEGLPTVALEAAAAGLPVVVGDSGGAAETVRQGETGFVVNSLDPQETASRLIELLLDRDRAATMGAAGRAWMAQEWTWDQRAALLGRLLAGAA
ncbi:MAG: glycosyltransferase family 4 protein [Bifidobacteriaceae bacterium]|jgi:phosphatidylinositol alpha-1,6-mannosyltransferase|nr:glycosyltransferase family 4 protein [Bifidobacteriaceae bacterium]